MKKGDKVVVSDDPNGYTTHPDLLYTSKTFDKMPEKTCNGIIVGEVTDIVKPFGKGKDGKERRCFAVEIDGNIFYILDTHLEPEVIITAEEMMEGLANTKDLETFKTKLRLLTTDWMNEGHEKDDIKVYIGKLIDKI